MSKLFFDHLLSLEKVEKEIKRSSSTKEEEEELWRLVDEIVQCKILDCILERLPEENHPEFLEMYHKAPYDMGIMEFLVTKIGENIEEIIRQEIGGLAYELLAEIRGKEVEKPGGHSEKK
jgi:hypothetical protein